jgi:hypothetical protein
LWKWEFYEMCREGVIWLSWGAVALYRPRPCFRCQNCIVRMSLAWCGQMYVSQQQNSLIMRFYDNHSTPLFLHTIVFYSPHQCNMVIQI